MLNRYVFQTRVLVKLFALFGAWQRNGSSCPSVLMMQ